MESETTSTTGNAPVHEVKGSGNKWLWPLIIIVAGIAFMWYLLRGCNNAPVPPEPKTDTVSINQTYPAPMMVTVSMKVKLTDGKELDALKAGIKDHFVAFVGGDLKSMSDNILRNEMVQF
jgi:hypothetical protein